MRSLQMYSVANKGDTIHGCPAQEMDDGSYAVPNKRFYEGMFKEWSVEWLEQVRKWAASAEAAHLAKSSQN